MSHILTDEEYKSQKRSVWIATGWLTLITVIEVGVALLWLKFEFMPRYMLNLLMIFASILKAFFIVAEFMHLKYEKRALMLSILVPLVLFIWGTVAFLIEGNSIKALRTLFA